MEDGGELRMEGGNGSSGRGRSASVGG
jgi:hypothetical protein